MKVSIIINGTQKVNYQGVECTLNWIGHRLAWIVLPSGKSKLVAPEDIGMKSRETFARQRARNKGWL